MSVLDRIANLDRWLVSQTPWWGYPAAMLVAGLAATLGALLFQPGPNEWVLLFGEPFGEVCASYELFQRPCPQCGMTRSWVHAIRGELWLAARYNPAGVLMLLWLQFLGALGAIRLLRRDPDLATVPFSVVISFALFWLAIYGGSWGARLAGYNPLPELPPLPRHAEAPI